MATKEAILEALGKLDAKNDDHWTADGSPRIDVVKTLLGEDIDRNGIIIAAPSFNRKSAASAPETPPAQTPPGGVVTPPDEPPAGADDVPGKSDEQLRNEALTKLQSADQETKDAARAEAIKAREERFERLKVLNERKAELDAEHDAIHSELAQIERFLEKLDPPMSTGETIQAYLESSKAAKLKRAEEVQKLRALAIDQRSLSVKSPLDAAMAGKRK